MKDLTEQELQNLADTLLQDKQFVDRVVAATASRLAHMHKGMRDNIAGKIKFELQEFFMGYKDKRIMEIQDEVSSWVNGHMRRQLEDLKAKMVDKVKKYIDTKMYNSFDYIASNIIEKLIREQFNNTALSFTIGDLFRNKDNKVDHQD